MTDAPDKLPEGWLIAWYGDDFTGSSAVMEVLSFAGVPAVLFLQPPSAVQLAGFAGYKACGIAGTARSQTPLWMERHLPAAIRTLKRLDAPVFHYKVCSTFDSSPAIGSIGKAIELVAPIIGSDWIPLLVAAPEIGRYQIFGNLFAVADGVGHRLDRHPTMRRHPATPMDEADLRLHLGKQTDRSIGLIDFVALKQGRAQAMCASERAEGADILALDVVDDASLQACGRLIWEGRSGPRLVVGSQGVEYALIAHWLDTGRLTEASPPKIEAVDRLAAVSGSCSPETARQIHRASEVGFAAISVDASLAVDPASWEREMERSAALASKVVGEGRDPILFTALGPDDPAVAAFNAAVDGQDPVKINARIGAGLGEILGRVLKATGIRRGIIAGGDTSGHAALALGVHALTAIAPISPGASVTRAHADDPEYADLQIALKGGQMGTPDYFSEIRQGRRHAS